MNNGCLFPALLLLAAIVALGVALAAHGAVAGAVAIVALGLGLAAVSAVDRWWWHG